MANCVLNSNLLRSNTCGYSLGQISRIYLANYDQVSAVTLSSDAQEVDGITMVSGGKWYQIDPARNSATWTDELVVTDQGGKYRTHTLNFSVLGTYSPVLADALDALSLGRYIAVIKRSDETYVMLGRVGSLEASAATAGGSSDDSVANGIQITLTANAAEVALPLSSQAISNLEGALAPNA